MRSIRRAAKRQPFKLWVTPRKKRQAVRKKITVLVTALAMITASVNADIWQDYQAGKATVMRVEVDGIVVRTKSGCGKLYFIELSSEDQRKYHYDPQQAAEAQAAQVAAAAEANQQAAEINAQRGELMRIAAQRAARQNYLQGLVNSYQNLLQQEQDLLAEIGRIRNSANVAYREWLKKGLFDGNNNQRTTNPDEANLPLLEGQLQNVRAEKERVRHALDEAQQQMVVTG